MASSSPALQVYRGLLKTALQTFRGDARAIRMARVEIRKAFQESRSIKDEALVAAKVEEGRDAIVFLKEAVVQAKRDENGGYSVPKEKAEKLKSLKPDEILVAQ